MHVMTCALTVPEQEGEQVDQDVRVALLVVKTVAPQHLARQARQLLQQGGRAQEESPKTRYGVASVGVGVDGVGVAPLGPVMSPRAPARVDVRPVDKIVLGEAPPSRQQGP